jgi:RNA polymerase sigma-70 factor (ECF subfamily)
MDETSHSLLERLGRKPDDASWRRLIDLYTPLLRGMLKSYHVPAEDADDLVQEVFSAVVRELPDFRHNGQRGAFRRWLRTIAVNRLRGYWRARQIAVRGAGGNDVFRRLDELEDPASAPSRQWDREHDEYVARRLLELLEPEFTPTTWTAFRRQVMDGGKPAEVARELDISTNAVLLAKSRVLRRMRQEIDGLTD